MKIYDFTPVDPSIGKTRTYEHFYKFLGVKPQQLGLVATLYKDLTPLAITERLANIVYNSQSLNKFQSINSMMYEYDIKTNYLKRIKFAEQPIDTSGEGGQITMAFTENYYNKYDIFVIEQTRQQCICLSRPIRRHDMHWEIQVRIIDNDYRSTLDLSGCRKGMKTYFISNAHPELSEEGYTKRQSNIEKHRNYITTFRNDISTSSLYNLQEEVFTTVENNKGQQKHLKLMTAEKELFDNFQYSRSTGLLLNKCNVGVDGKPTIQDPDTGRDIYISDGLLPQIERYCSKHIYNKMTIGTFDIGMAQMNTRADNPTGNKYVVACNTKFWNDCQYILRNELKNSRTDSLLWSKGAKGYVKVGATFDSYEFGGNVIMFKVDKSLDEFYGSEKGFGAIIDLTKDANSSVAPVNLFTIKGSEFIHNVIKGVGGLDGRSSGEVSTPVAGSKMVIHGYAGIGVMNPYKSFIMMEA